MKAIVYHEYGSADVLKCEEIEKPVPKDDEILIKVRAASVNPLDWRLMRGEPRVLRIMPRLLKMPIGRPGVDVAGEVEAVGKNVTQFKPGDQVFGGCRGAFAEYATTREKSIATKPESLTYEQAASIYVAGLTALQGLRDKGKLQPGQKVLVNGAAGGVGTFAVQIAKSFGADVTGVCSTRNLEMVKSIGANAVIDYTKEDFTKLPRRYDLILECVGNHSFSECRRVLNTAGRFVMVGGPHDPSVIGLLTLMIKPLLLSPFVSQKAVMFIAKSRQDDLILLGELIATGKLKPVIDSRYSLGDAADALRRSEEGHARGKVIIDLSGRSPLTVGEGI
jgi:NADPH:quinone reductase-like Zn-dependent oxidoreductase